MDLIGRAAEFSILDAFLDRAFGDGAAQLLTGGPGVGRTAPARRRLPTGRGDDRRPGGARCGRRVRGRGRFRRPQPAAGLPWRTPRLPGLTDVHRNALRGRPWYPDSGPAAGPLGVSVAALVNCCDTSPDRGRCSLVIDEAAMAGPPERPGPWVHRPPARRQPRRHPRRHPHRHPDSVLLHVNLPRARGTAPARRARSRRPARRPGTPASPHRSAGASWPPRRETRSRSWSCRRR